MEAMTYIQLTHTHTEQPPAEPYYESTSGYDPQVDEPEPDQPMYDDVQEVAGGRGGGEEGGGPAEEVRARIEELVASCVQ